MAKTYRLTAAQRSANLLFRTLTKLGLGARYRWVLSVPGRTTGTLRSTPVDVMQVGGHRWLVAPYGEVNWVRNLRACGGALTLRRGGQVEQFAAQEVRAGDAVPAIREYLRRVPVTATYWDVTADSTDRDIAADSARHPVFRISPALC